MYIEPNMQCNFNYTGRFCFESAIINFIRPVHIISQIKKNKKTPFFFLSFFLSSSFFSFTLMSLALVPMLVQYHMAGLIESNGIHDLVAGWI